MKFDILTLFPDQIKEMLAFSILGRAQNEGLISVQTHNLRDFGLGKHQQVDDTPYGGGAGMVMRPDVVIPAIRSVKAANPTAHVILLTPQGTRFTQNKAEELSSKEGLILICGHYEGFDERIRGEVDEEISLGDFVLTGGELASAVMIDAIARLVPQVLTEGSAHEESHTLKNEVGERLLEYPQYTKPEEFEGQKVPPVLLSGNHAEINKWRAESSRPAQK